MTLLTSREEIERVFSVDGVTNHTSDEVDDQLIIEEIIVRASEEVLLFLRSQFNPEDCKNNPWVRGKATYIACYFISIRRGEGNLYGNYYEEAMMQLSAVRDGLLSPGLPGKARAVLQTPQMHSRTTRPQRINVQASTRILPKQNPYDGKTSL